MWMKLKKFLLISIFIFLFGLSFVSAGLIYEAYQETAEIISKDNVHYSIQIFVNIDESQDLIDLFLIPNVKNLQVFLDDQEIKNCQTNVRIGKTDVLCNLEKPVLGKHFLQIEFDSSYPLIKLNQNRLMFRSGYEPLIETKNFIFTLKLPLGYIIPEEPGKDKGFFISPEADNLYSDGQRIILRWQEKSLSKRFDVSVISEPLKPKFKFQFAVLILILAIILFLWFSFKKKIFKEKIVKKLKKKNLKKKEKSKSEIIEGHLIESEKAVIDELKNADKNELWQKQIQLKTGFSKAKLSRVIRNLESRNLIKKTPFGNTNIIKLKIK